MEAEFDKYYCAFMPQDFLWANLQVQILSVHLGKKIFYMINVAITDFTMTLSQINGSNNTQADF